MTGPNPYSVPGLDRTKEINNEFISKIIDAVLFYRGHNSSVLKSKNLDRKFSYTRQLVCYFLTEYTSLGPTHIGRYLNKMDHSTVAQSSKKIKELINIYDDVKTDVRNIYKMIFSTSIQN